MTIQNTVLARMVYTTTLLPNTNQARVIEQPDVADYLDHPADTMTDEKYVYSFQ